MTALYDDWMTLRAAGGHGLEHAEALGVPEVRLVDAAVGRDGPVRARRLGGDPTELLGALAAVGPMKAITRNRNAVLEVEGPYGPLERVGHMAQVLGPVDLRVFGAHWRHAYEVHEASKRGTSRSLQFFDREGRALHKAYTRDRTDVAALDRLVADAAARADEAPRELALERPAPPPPERPDAAVDAAGLRAAWRGLTDTHEFFGLLRRFEVSRTQALRLGGPELASPARPGALEAALRGAAGGGVPIMIFVGNPGLIQIHSGPVERVVTAGPWVNVLDRGTNLHARADGVASAWIVRKPTADGVVTALETYDAAGELVALFVGLRKPGRAELPDWRALAESLA